MNQQIKAIETVYNGYRFRSRLEARWAVFFDTLGIKYEYEKEGYDLGEAGWYLPDFWLPDLECWVEIKGQHPTRDEQTKLAVLTEQRQDSVGVIRSTTPDVVANEGYGYWSGKFAGWQTFAQCLGCDAVGMMILSEQSKTVLFRMRCACDRTLFGITPDTPELQAACAAARQARFEHGETPTIANRLQNVDGSMSMKKVLRTSKPSSRSKRSKHPGRIVMPEEWWSEPETDLNPGDKVEHRLFGCGVVQRKQYNTVEVLFDDGERRTLDAQYARLKWTGYLGLSLRDYLTYWSQDTRPPDLTPEQHERDRRDAEHRLRSIELKERMAALDSRQRDVEKSGDREALHAVLVEKQALLAERRELDEAHAPRKRHPRRL